MTNFKRSDGINRYEKEFERYIDRGVEYKLLNPELKEFNLKKIASALDFTRDHLFQYLGARTIADRYLLKTPTRPQKIFELPQWMWMRVAMGLALKEEHREERAIQFYNVLSQFCLFRARQRCLTQEQCIRK